MTHTSAGLAIVLQKLAFRADAVVGAWGADTLELTAVLHSVTQVVSYWPSSMRYSTC